MASMDSAKAALSFKKRFDQLGEIACVERLEPAWQTRIAAFVPLRPRMDHRAAAEGALGGFIAHDKVIAAQNQQRFFESDLAVDGFFRLGFLLCRRARTIFPKRSAAPM